MHTCVHARKHTHTQAVAGLLDRLLTTLFRINESSRGFREEAAMWHEGTAGSFYNALTHRETHTHTRTHTGCAVVGSLRC